MSAINKNHTTRGISQALLIILILAVHGSHCKDKDIVEGLNKRLEQFEMCNIRITADFSGTEIEPIAVPVILLDAEKRSSFYFIVFYHGVCVQYTYP